MGKWCFQGREHIPSFDKSFQPCKHLRKGGLQKEGAGEQSPGALAPLLLCFLLEPSPSWAVREKRGYWLLIPNIT